MHISPQDIVTRHAQRPHKLSGFTLIELMMVVAIIGILAAIAVPSYSKYLLKGKVTAAQADLVALSLNLENSYQRQLSYPPNLAAIEEKTKDTLKEHNLSSWRPVQKDDFTYSYEKTASGNSAYTVTAKAKTSSTLAGCTLTLSSDNARAATAACLGSSTW